MPRIETYGAPRVGPALSTQARFQAADNDGGIGTALGDGLNKIGNAMAEHVIVKDQVNLAYDDLQQQRETLNFREGARNILSSYTQLEGQAAVEGKHDVDQQLDALKKETIAKASSPRMRKMLEDNLRRYHADAGFQANEHAVGQFKVEREQTWQSQLSLSANDAAAEAIKAPEMSAAHIREGSGVFDKMAEFHGWSPDTLKLEKGKWRSGVHTRIIGGMIADGDEDLANAYRQAHDDELTAADRISIQADLKAPLEKRQAAADVDGAVVGPTPAKGPAGAPVADGGAVVRSLFPGIVITSTSRSKDDPLTKANPKSWHANSNAAVDARPIKGMSFAKYVRGFEDAGYHVIEAKEEVGSGRSAHATGDHWHVVLGERRAVTQQGPRRWDLNAGFAAIDQRAAKEGWDSDRRDRAKDELEGRARRDDMLLARQEEDADDAVTRLVTSMGDRFTDASQLPPSLRGQLSPAALARYTDVAKYNSKPKAVAANGDDALLLNLMSVDDPESFMKIGLGGYRGKVTPAELESLAMTQMRMKKEGPNGKEVSIRSNITSAIDFRAKIDPSLAESLNVKKNPGAYMRLFTDMAAHVRSMTEGKREPTDSEIETAFNRATMKVIVEEPGMFGPKSRAVSRFDAPDEPALHAAPGVRFRGSAGKDQVIIPRDVYQRMSRSYAKVFGNREPPDGYFGKVYLQYKGQPGYW
ncbi:hypothetical protein BH10PSE12_BH10PSE12_16590 [soil metagenome]